MTSPTSPITKHCSNIMPNFRFEKHIGSGSFGSVYKAFDRNKNIYVAVKRSAKIGSLVSREYKILKETEKCENCVQLLDIFYTVNDQGGCIQHLVFEYVPENLSRFIRERCKSHNYLTYDEVSNIMRQILLGLEFLHSKKIMHRDLKPENILIDPITMKVKLCDFGSAKKQNGKSAPYIVSRYYRAPELIFCNTEYGPEIDIWAAGCIFIELFTGVPTFIGKSEGDQFIQQAKVLGPPSLSDITRLVENTVIKVKIAAKATQIGVRRDISQMLPKGNKSAEALELIEKMLSWDYKKRPSARDCLEHPFFSNN
ncbi:unnamed protein product [Blepharisma stoltei]|uniref:Protein kinase domain-containing protein n=1 Tax=Blepharisma stoltei TaxID=1481888 RepID=A0AAU9K670_9CILI|nr:unnamed protein product [Blepharisma stoltei]